MVRRSNLLSRLCGKLTLSTNPSRCYHSFGWRVAHGRRTRQCKLVKGVHLVQCDNVPQTSSNAPWPVKDHSPVSVTVPRRHHHGLCLPRAFDFERNLGRFRSEQRKMLISSNKLEFRRPDPTGGVSTSEQKGRRT